jgi:Flp pilus assembly protein TadD
MDLTSETRRTILVCALLTAATLITFWPLTGCDFINYDDTAYVTENPHVLTGLSLANAGWAFRTSCLGNWHPLTMLSHMLDVQLFGLNPGWHHSTNLCFHVANTVLLFLLLRRLTRRVWPSAFVAALFALHPLHVESVAWVSERKDVLSTFFSLLSLWAYGRYARTESSVERRASSAGAADSALAPRPSTLDPLPSGGRLPAALFYLLSLGCFALGLMSKPMLVTLPFIMLLLDYWPLRRFHLSTLNPQPATTQPLLRLLLEKWPFFFLSAIACIVTVIAQQESGAVQSLAVIPVGERIENALVAYARYLGKTLWPHALAIPYPPVGHWPFAVAALAAVLLAALSFGALWVGRKFPFIAVGWLWFLGTLVPVIGIIQAGDQSLADRYTYFPLVGLFIALVWTAADIAPGWHHRRAVLAAAASALLLLCAVATRVQLRCWRDSETLFLHAIEVTRGNHVAHNGLGLHLFKRGKVAEAIAHYEAALQINPLYDVAHSNLGRALADQRRYDEAMAQFKTALSLRPDDVKTLNNLGSVLVLQGRHAEAVRHFEEAVRLQPDHAAAHNNLAISCKKLGRIGEAIAHYREALRLQPDSLESLNNLAWMLAACPDARFRNGAEAVLLAMRACELTRYQNPVTLATLAAAYAETGKFHEAVSFAERAQELARGGQPALVAHLSTLLEAFRAGRPNHAD